MVLPVRIFIILLFFSGKLFAQKPYTAAKIPFASTAVVWLDGTVKRIGANWYFIDKSGNGRNFLITGFDFDSTNVQKGFPYKSAATISAPSGDATLQANDIDSFFYTSGTPNQIPVVSLFQDIGYDHKIFTRHLIQVLSSDTTEVRQKVVKDIVCYNSFLSGTNLTKCQTYYRVPTEVTGNVIWVTKWGNDATGTGSKAAPVKTIQKAYDLGVLYPIYVKSGVYLENNGSSYLRPTRVKTCTAIGRVEVNAASASTLITIDPAAFTMNNIILNARNTNNNVIQDAGTVAKKVVFNNCFFTGGKTSLLAQSTYDTTQFNDCVISGNAQTSVNQCHSNLFNSCYINGFNQIMYRNPVFKLCKLRNVFIQNSGNISATFQSNIINNSNGLVSSSSTGAFTFTRNVVTVNTGATTFIGWGVLATSFGQITIYKNKFTSTAGASGNCIDVSSANTLITNNIFDLALGTYGLGGVSTSLVGYSGGIKINENWVKSNLLTGIVCSINGEQNYLSATGCEFIGNTVIGSRLDYPGTVSTCHGVFIENGGNSIIKDNKISYHQLGMIIKCGDGVAYTSGGCYSNLLIDNVYNIWMKGVGGITVSNNTISYSSRTYTTPFAYGILADENSAWPGTQNSENCLLKNNIFDINTNVGALIEFDSWAAVHGCISQNSVLNGGANLLVDGTYYTSLSTAQAAGKLLNCVVQNPNLSASFIPNPYIAIGENLGTSFNRCLDTLTNWGSVLINPIIINKNQVSSGAWQLGAYIQ